MAARDDVAENTAKEIVIERVFDAPRERVFEAFTRAEHLQQWWGPAMVTVPVAEFEARAGGRLFFAERAPDGAMVYIAGVVREIEPPTRLVIAIHFADASKRRVAPPSRSGLPGNWQGEIVATVLFGADGQRTRVTVRQSLSSVTAEWGEGARQGWGESLEKLGAALARMR